MYLAADLFREIGAIAVCLSSGMQFVAPGRMPGKPQRFDCAEEVTQVGTYLINAVRFLKWEYGEEIELAVFTVPYHFSHSQKRTLLRLARQAGISKVRLCYPTELNAYAHYSEDNPDRQQFLCLWEPGRLEFAVCRMGEGVLETEGVTGVLQGSQESQEDFCRRALREIRQFEKDAPAPWDICQILLAGDCPEELATGMQDYFHKPPIYVRDRTMQGAFDYARFLNGRLPGGPLLLPCIPFDLSVALGDMGERRVLAERYCTVPLRKIDQLLVSTQTTLTLYEGNYHNPKFDTALASYQLANVQEGHEITCTLDIDSWWNLQLTVQNDLGELILQDKL